MGEGTNDNVVAAPPGYGGKMFRAFDKATGQTMWEMELPGGVSGAPMTYLRQRQAIHRRGDRPR